MRFHDDSVRTGCWIGVAAVMICLTQPALSEPTKVARGDVLRVEITDAPEFSREAPVDADGRIALPVVGQIGVAGLDLEAARQSIEEALRTRGLLNAPQVVVEIAVYRPIYVGGSVRDPGAVTFVPGLTARQAIISAGGIGLPDEDLVTPPENALAALAARRASSFRLAQVTARIERLEAELAGRSQMAGTARDAFSEGDWLNERRQRMAERSTHTQSLLELIDKEVDTLDRQKALQDDEAKLQQSEIDDARSLVERGLMPRNQLQEMLRDQSQLNRDQLDNRAFAARAAQAAVTTSFQLSDELAREREDLRSELADTRVQRATIMAELEGLNLEILAAGLSGTGAEPGAPAPRLTIHRLVDGAATQLETGMDDLVLPGDVLELSLIPPESGLGIGQ